MRKESKTLNLNFFYLVLFTLFILLIPASYYLINELNTEGLSNDDETAIINPDREAFSEVDIRISINGNIEYIKLWFEDGIYYAFLPSCAEMNRTYLTNDCKLFIDNEEYGKKDSLNDIELNKKYSLKEECEYFTNESEVIFMKSSNIATIFINTESGNLDALMEDKDYSEKAYMTLYNKNGRQEYNDDLEFISGRGNQTWGYDKRPWTIKTIRDVRLLDMPADSKWVLIANAGEDSTGLRNMVAYSLAENIELTYASHMEFTDLYLNNEYYGTYELTEKIEVSENRMNIGNLNSLNRKSNSEETYEELISNPIEVTNEDGSFYTYADITSPNDISGGYIIERNYGSKWAAKAYRFTTSRGECFNVRAPSAPSKEEMEYLLSICQSVENALYSDDFTDEVTGKGIEELIDIDSWALKYLVEEITKNSSGGSTSSYFYIKNGDQKLYAGPAWDYDKSLGTVSPYVSAEGLSYCSWHTLNKTIWWKLIYDYEPYKNRVKEFYAGRVKPYINLLVDGQIDEWAETVEDSFNSNYYRWRNYYGFLDICHVGELQQNAGNIRYSADYIKDWLVQRTEFLDKVWLDDEVYHNIFIMKNSSTYQEIRFIKDGDTLGELPDTGSENLHWINANDGTVVNENTVVHGEMILELK